MNKMKVLNAEKTEIWPDAAQKRGALRDHERAEHQLVLKVDHASSEGEDHHIVIPLEAIADRMHVYGLETHEEAIEAILREHTVRLGDLEPHSTELPALFGGQHPDVELDTGKHLDGLLDDHARGLIDEHYNDIARRNAAPGAPDDAPQIDMASVALAIKNHLAKDPHDHEVGSLAEVTGHPAGVVAHVLDSYTPTAESVLYVGEGQGGGWLPEDVARQHRTERSSEDKHVGYRWPDGSLNEVPFDIHDQEHRRLAGISEEDYQRMVTATAGA